jgi:hypothetical protein
MSFLKVNTVASSGEYIGVKCQTVMYQREFQIVKKEEKASAVAFRLNITIEQLILSPKIV